MIISTFIIFINLHLSIGYIISKYNANYNFVINEDFILSNKLKYHDDNNDNDNDNIKINKNIIDSNNINDNKKIINNNNKIITIAPAGLRGFYSLGVASYVKDKYDLKDCIFSGASAGAWISLCLSYKGNSLKIPLDILSLDYNDINSIFKLQMYYKKYFLENFTDNDFELEKIYIGVTEFDNIQPVTHIYTGFKTIQDTIDCCIASSHIPFLSGKILNKYYDKVSFDGGFSAYPYVDYDDPILHINLDMWKKEKGYLLIDKNINYCNTLFGLQIKQMENMKQMFYNGFSDSMNNSLILDNIFNKYNE